MVVASLIIVTYVFIPGSRPLEMQNNHELRRPSRMNWRRGVARPSLPNSGLAWRASPIWGPLLLPGTSQVLGREETGRVESVGNWTTYLRLERYGAGQNIPTPVACCLQPMQWQGDSESPGKGGFTRRCLGTPTHSVTVTGHARATACLDCRYPACSIWLRKHVHPVPHGYLEPPYE